MIVQLRECYAFGVAIKLLVFLFVGRHLHNLNLQPLLRSFDILLR